ncbi:MAG: hypothetical protein ACI8R4_001393 [Paracoccaceae bacterium]|jgi:hypothetical protein
MILHELTGSEEHPAYQALEITNGERHYSFLQSIIAASLAVGRPFLSQTVIKAINFHAIACLHTNPGEYRPCQVTVGDYIPPQHHRVAALMDDFVHIVNRQWDSTDAVELSSFVLWKMNSIHPFINGNGRTARAASYFVLCVKLGGWLDGDRILPELLRSNRPEYVAALKLVDASAKTGNFDLAPLHAIISRLLSEQLPTDQKED